MCEEKTFRSVFDQFGRSLRNFLYYKCGNIELAADLTQEAFLRLWQKCAMVAPEKAKSFLFTVANNLMLDHIKHEKIVLNYKKEKQPVLSKVDPGFLLEEEEFRQKMIQAIQKLPEANRVVFLMSRIDQLTYQEIADRLGISKKAVEKRMSKALIALKKMVSAWT